MQQTAAAPASTTSQPAGALFARLIETVWNGRDVAALSDLLAPDFVMHTTGGLHLDAAGYEAAVRAYHEGFSDLRVEVLGVIEQGALFAARVQLFGTMDGAFGGHAATGRPMRVEGHPWVRVEKGRIAELWSLVDDATLWAQLGLPPHTL